MADLRLRRWAGDPTTLLVLMLPLGAWAATHAIASGEVLPTLALVGVVAALALSGST